MPLRAYTPLTLVNQRVGPTIDDLSAPYFSNRARNTPGPHLNNACREAMKEYTTDRIRNIALVGSTNSGKTLLAEAMLFEGKVIERKGTIEGKNTASDYSEIEQINAKSIFATSLYTEFMDHKLNLFDTPGADDFIGAQLTSLAASDLAVMVVNAQHGVEVGTEILHRRVESAHKPMVLAINQLDHEKANHEATMESINHAFGSKAVVVQYPVNPGTSFNSFIDVLLMKMYSFTGTDGQREELPIPEAEMERAKALNGKLVEAAAENDEALMELYFEKGALTENEIRKGLAIGLASGELYPVFCLSGLRSIGVKRLMEFIIRVGPSPDKPEAPADSEGNPVPCKEEEPTSLFVFRTSNEMHVGEISYFKLTSGTLTENMDLVNVNTGTKERISQIFYVAGKNRAKVSTMHAGDIGATVKLKGTRSNDTLCAPGHERKFPPLQFPHDKFRTAIKPTNEAETDKLSEMLAKAHNEDLTINVEFSKELRQIIVSGQGEHHLNILKWQLENLHKINVEYLPPRIPYRETITKAAQADYRHKKQSGGAGQFGEVHLMIEPYIEGEEPKTKHKINGKELVLNIRDTEELPLEWGGKLVFHNCVVGGAIDARFMPAILKGIMEKMEEGPLTGSYARDIRVFVYDGKMHPVDSNEISFKLAGRNAFRTAFKEAGPKIMEPVYQVEVLVPSDKMGEVMSDLQNRRATILGMDSDKGFERLKALVPLAEMGRYSTALSSLTNGRATYSMAFHSYEHVPGDLQEKLLKAYEETESEE